MILMRADQFQVRLEGVGPENQDLSGPEMAPSKASAISGPKFELNRNPQQYVKCIR
jgi:hypothetical protein